MMYFLTGSFLIWLPKIVLGLILGLTVLHYAFRNKIRFFPGFFQFFNFKALTLVAVSFRIFYAFAETVLQYYVWINDNFSRLFLNSPLKMPPEPPFFIRAFSWISDERLGYFLFYSYMRFWLNLLAVFLAAVIFYLILKTLKKYRERFLEVGEINFGFLLVLIVGWPNFLVFVPLICVFVVLSSIFRRLFLKEFYTTLGWPMLAASLVDLFWGGGFINILNLTGFKI